MSADTAPHTFIAESSELLRDMETALLRIEQSPDDAEAVNALFRAVHTIKGSSGMFGFDSIVELTHAMESVMVDVRDGQLGVDGDLIALLLGCGDQVASMIDCLGTDDRMARLAAVGAANRDLLAQLDCYSPSVRSDEDAVFDDRLTDRHGETALAAAPQSGIWHVSVRFPADIMRDGMDPLSVLRYLATLGEVVGVATLFDAMPPADAMDPEACYVGLEIRFRGSVHRQDIEAAFDYVRDGSTIHILSPDCATSDYLDLIDALPESNERLAEALVSCGALVRPGSTQPLQGDRGSASAAAVRTMATAATAAQASDASSASPVASTERRAGDSRFIRVHAGKLDELINLVGELVISSAGVSMRARGADAADLREAAANLGRLVEEVRDGALALRMVPIGETFNRFRRVVHDLGRTLGKDVDLVISGAETELDKSMVEKLTDPLMHLVRNAMDHGIEPAERRLLSGKPARGRLMLNAYHETGNIVIEVADDGAGLDRDKVLARALAAGLVSADHSLSDREVHQLVMEPGFSTADHVTNISGRGIGMDVVKRNIEAMRGSVTIDSQPGQGTTMALRVPLTLAIIDGFLVGVAKSAYVVPLEMVVECLELTAEDRLGMRDTGYLNLRGEVLPLLRLREVFDIRGEPARRENIVVVHYAGQRAGLLVDSLMGEFQTVIKPLGKLFERLAGISGSTILGTGEVALILDVQALVQQAVDAETHGGAKHIFGGERTC